MLHLALAVVLGASNAQAAEIAHETFILDNGLEVVLIPDNRLPQVVVDLWYDVGGYDDPQGRSGFAHLFEHLMFKGTERVGEGQFDSTMEKAGGWNNASTAPFRTNYYDVGPDSALDLLLWLEADRMTSLDVTQEKLDTEREVVRNERRQNTEDAPYGEAFESMSALVYPASNPASRSVIGTHEELMAASLDDVRSFYETYYVPSNAVLAVAGDFDVAATKARIQALFGSLPAKPKPVRELAPMPDKPVTPSKDFTDRVSVPMSIMAWQTPAFYQPGDADYDVLGTILFGSEDSRLQRRLVHEDQVAIEVAGGQSSGRWDGQFYLYMLTLPGSDFSAAEAIVADELAKIASGEAPITEEEVERARNNLEMSLIRGAETVMARAELLQNYRMMVGRYDYFAEDLARYAAVTPASVTEWAKKLTPDRRLTIHVTPEPADGGAE